MLFRFRLVVGRFYSNLWIHTTPTFTCRDVKAQAQVVAIASRPAVRSFLASLVAVFGEFDISGELETKRSVTKNVRRVIVNRGYDPATFENDLALLELESPVQFDEHIVPICMPEDGTDFTGRMATVTGWGRLKYSAYLSVSLLRDSPSRARVYNNTRGSGKFLARLDRKYEMERVSMTRAATFTVRRLSRDLIARVREHARRIRGSSPSLLSLYCDFPPAGFAMVKVPANGIPAFDRWWRAVGAARGPGAHHGERGVPGDVPNRRTLETHSGQLPVRRIRQRPEGLLRGTRPMISPLTAPSSISLLPFLWLIAHDE